MIIRENISLKPYHTFGMDVSAKYFASFTTEEDLLLLTEDKIQSIKNILPLGGGSNILFTKNFDGLVLKNDIRGIEVVREDSEYIYLKVGAGENWHQLVMYCVSHGWCGVENLALIPGNAGASPMQNIGAYGIEIKDVFHELEAFHLAEKRMGTFSLADCDFGYRESVFKKKYKNQFIITSVTYRLNKKPSFHIEYGAIKSELEKSGITELTPNAIAQAVIRIRESKLPDPAKIGNAGSFFKNPSITKQQFDILKTTFSGIVGYDLPDGKVKLAAGWLIEQCGWKGYRKGNAGCYDKQALVLVNYSNANGEEIFDLSEKIIETVKQKFNVELEREVNIF